MEVRTTIWLMLFATCTLCMILGTSINVAILAMVKYRPTTSLSPLEDAAAVDTTLCPVQFVSVQINHSLHIATLIHVSSVSENNVLDWSESEQNLVVGAGFWLSGIAQLFGGFLSHRFGPKKMIGYTMFFNGLGSSLTPYFAYRDYRWVLWLRVFQGFIGGLALPVAIFGVMAKWCPPDERGRFMAVFLAVPIGEAVSYVVTGFVSDRFGWTYVFYLMTVLTTVWYITWLWFMHDSPEEHPRIGYEEREYICKHRQEVSANSKELAVPWKDMLTSCTFWMCTGCGFGSIWLYTIISVYGPAYLRNAFRISTEDNGVVSSIPYISKAAFTYIAGALSDFMISKKPTSVTNVRKLNAFLGNVLAGLFLLGVLYDSCNVWIVMISITLSITLTAFYTIGPSVALVDISPNFCEILQGVSGSISFGCGLLCTVTSEYFIQHYEPNIRWKNIFLLAGSMSIIPGLMFIIFAKCEVKSWNTPKHQRNDRENVKFSKVPMNESTPVQNWLPITYNRRQQNGS